MVRLQPRAIKPPRQETPAKTTAKKAVKAPAKKTPVARKAPARPTRRNVNRRKPTPATKVIARPRRKRAAGFDVHEAYLQYRLGGAERPDPEIYRRAIEQFQSLPGAFRTTPPPAPADESETTGDEPTPDEANEGETS